MDTLCYKYFLIKHLDIIEDIYKIILKLKEWRVILFKLPELSEFNNCYYTYKNKEGIIFKKFPSQSPTKHEHKEKASYMLHNGQNICYLSFFYENDLRHYYMLKVAESKIHNLALFHYVSKYKSKHNNDMYIDPTFEMSF